MLYQQFLTNTLADYIQNKIDIPSTSICAWAEYENDDVINFIEPIILCVTIHSVNANISPFWPRHILSVSSYHKKVDI